MEPNVAKTDAPMLSFAASGQIAKTQVYSSWRGIGYARRYVIPANPNTAAQQETRSVFKWASQVWKLAGPLLQGPWTSYSTGQPFTNRNAFISSAVKNLRGQTDLTAFVGSPGAKGGLPAASIAAAVSSTTITVTLGAPDLPAGWTITNAVAVALPNVDPSTAVAWNSYEAGDAATPYEIAIASLPAATYELSAWFVYTKPDGTTAYGPSINATATVT